MFYGHMFISLKVISVLQKKRNRRDEKEVDKKKNKVMKFNGEHDKKLILTSQNYDLSKLKRNFISFLNIS